MHDMLSGGRLGDIAIETMGSLGATGRAAVVGRMGRQPGVTAVVIVAVVLAGSNGGGGGTRGGGGRRGGGSADPLTGGGGGERPSGGHLRPLGDVLFVLIYHA